MALVLPLLAMACRGSAPVVAARGRTPDAAADGAIVMPSVSPPEIRLPAAIAHVKFTGGTGFDCDHPARIEKARNVAEGHAAEKAWLASVYPGARRHEQGIGRKEGRMLEGFALESADGRIVHACFDVSDFFGVW